MNKHILFVMRSLDNPELFTEQEKAENKESAFGSDAAYNAVYAAYAAANAVTNATVEYWVNKFFERTGEDKQVYINEVERLKEDKIMTIENQISVNCDEPEEISACELLDILIKGGEIIINNESYNLAEITDSICSTAALYAAEESISNNKHAINELYITQINEMLGE